MLMVSGFKIRKRCQMELKKVGKIVNTQGLKGDMRIYPSISDPTSFEFYEYLIIQGEGEKKFNIEKVRYKKNLVICKLEGLDHINDVEVYRERDVFIPVDLDVLNEGELFIEDLKTCVIIDKERGEIGRVIDVLNYKAHDILVGKSEQGIEFMIPYVDEFVKDVNLDEKVIEVELIEGMVDEV